MRTGLLTASILASPAIIHSAAYANTLTNLIPDIYAAMDVVSRELVGFVPSAMRAPGVERAALNQEVTYPIAPLQQSFNNNPAMQVPEPPDNAFDTGTMKITKSKGVAFGFVGEEERALDSAGPGFLTTQQMLIAQALRTLVNEVEQDGAIEAAANASRAYGTPGTTPFATNLADTAQLRKILDDNGAPLYGRSLIINTSAGANLRTLEKLTRVNEAGTQMTLRQGELLDIHGFSIKESGQAVYKTKGTGAGATTNSAGYAVGATVITLASAGTGTVTPGDVITFAGDTNKYVVVAGDVDVSNGGTVTIALPGLRNAIPAAATAITVGNSYAANVAFSQDALHVAMRPPAMPKEGDLRIDSLLLTDPRSGITFEVSVWPGYRKVRYEISLAWGWKATKREHIALLLG